MALPAGVLKLALEEAYASAYYPYRIGAVVFRGRRILGSGHNAIRASSLHPKYQRWPESLHAEQAALLGLDWGKLKGASVCVVRINMNGNLSMAYPCEMCLTMLRYVGIRKLYYSSRDGVLKMNKIQERV